MRIFTKTVLAFVALLAAGVTNAQNVEPVLSGKSLPVGGYVHEWRTSSTQFKGLANMEDDAYVVNVRSEQAARAAGTATLTNGNFGQFASWDSQFFIGLEEDNKLATGQKIRVIMQIKADVAANGIETQSHNAPGNSETSTYMSSGCIGNVNFTTEWEYFDSGILTVTQNGNAPRSNMRAIAFNLAKGIANKYYFKDIKVLVDDETQKVSWPNAPEGDMCLTSLLINTGAALNSSDNHWQERAYYNLSEALVPEAEYTLKLSMMAENPGEGRTVEFFTGTPNNNGFSNELWSGDTAAPTDEFTDFTWSFKATSANNKIGFSCGRIDGALFITNVSLIEKSSGKELIEDGTFSSIGHTYWSTWRAPSNWGAESGVVTPEAELFGTFVLDPNFTVDGINMPDDDAVIVAHKTALRTAINKGKNANIEGKTIASRNDLFAAIAAAEAILKSTESKLEDIDQARLDVLNAVDELENRTSPAAEKEVAKGWKSVITNGSLEGTDMSCFFSKVGGGDTENSVTYDYEGTDDFHAIVIETLASQKTYNWDDQFFIRANEEIPGGTKIRVEFDYRANIADNVDSQVHNEPGAYIPADGIGNLSCKPEWSHFTYEGPASATFRTLAFNLSANGKDTKIVIDNVVFWVELPKAKKDLTVNGSFEGTAVPNVMVKVAPSSAVVPATATEGAGTEGSKGLKIEAPAKVTNDYETQMWIVSPYVLPAGTSVQVEFDYKADVAAKVATQAHENPGNYIHYACAGDVEFTTEWKHFKATFAVPSQCDGKPNNENTYNKDFRSIAFNMSMSAATTYYIDNVKLLVDEETVDQIIATGVQAVRPAAVSDGQYYDLQGRRVAQPVKGMYIVNGKKTIVK